MEFKMDQDAAIAEFLEASLISKFSLCNWTSYWFCLHYLRNRLLKITKIRF